MNSVSTLFRILPSFHSGRPSKIRLICLLNAHFLIVSFFLTSVMTFSTSYDATSSDVESTECEMTTSRTLTVIKSVHFPEAYGPNIDCKYTIRRRGPGVCSVTFLFNVLDLEPSEDCERDYIKFHDSAEKFCGSKPVGFSRTVSFKKLDESGKTVFDETNPEEKEEIIMSFHSDNGTKGGLGYMVTVVQQDCPKASCDSTHSESDFIITSPNYPLPYDNGRSCTYIVQKSQSSVCKLFLTVKQFDVEEDEHCEADFFRIGKDGQRLCGALAPGQIVELSFTNDKMIMEFQSDHLTTRDGFEIEVHQEECHPFTTPSSLTSEQQQTESRTTTSETINIESKEKSTTPRSTIKKEPENIKT